MAAVLLAVALQALLFAMDTWPAPRALWGDEIMYADLARRLAAREPAHIDFLWPPAYPRFLAGLMVLGGGSFLLARCVQVALLALSALLLRDLGLRLVGSRLAADVGCDPTTVTAVASTRSSIPPKTNGTTTRPASTRPICHIRFDHHSAPMAAVASGHERSGRGRRKTLRSRRSDS